MVEVDHENTVPDAIGEPPMVELGTEPGKAFSGPTLNDAATGSDYQEHHAPEPEPEAPPLTNDQIMGLVAEVSSVGLKKDDSDAYKAEFMNNQMIKFGLDAAGLSDALAAYGINAQGGKLPEWLSLLLGVSVLGYGIYSVRGKYVAGEATATDVADFGGHGPSNNANAEQDNNFKFNRASGGEADPVASY